MNVGIVPEQRHFFPSAEIDDWQALLACARENPNDPLAAMVAADWAYDHPFQFADCFDIDPMRDWPALQTQILKPSDTYGAGIGRGSGLGSGFGKGAGYLPFGSGKGSGQGAGRGCGSEFGIGTKVSGRGDIRWGMAIMEIGKSYLFHCGDWHSFVDQFVRFVSPLIIELKYASKLEPGIDNWHLLAEGYTDARRAL